jgi:hypothetical protein
MEKSWMWWYTPVIPATQGSVKYEDHGSGKKWDAISKITRAKKARGVAQMIECLPSKCEEPSSNLSTGKKQRKKGNILRSINYNTKDQKNWKKMQDH